MRCITILKSAVDAQAQESSREQRSRATEAPQSQNGHMQHAVEHRAELSTGYALELKLLQGL